VLAAAASNINASVGSLEEVGRIVGQIRKRAIHTRTILRGDPSFCRAELRARCESHRVDYVVGFSRNQNLRRKIARGLREAKQEHRRTGKAARVLTEFRSRTRASGSR
jgi:hypothetical protein